jgi:hypothetical protein
MSIEIVYWAIKHDFPWLCNSLAEDNCWFWCWFRSSVNCFFWVSGDEIILLGWVINKVRKDDLVNCWVFDEISIGRWVINRPTTGGDITFRHLRMYADAGA